MATPKECVREWFERIFRGDAKGAFLFRVRDGKICEINEFLDTALVETAAYGKKLVSA